YVAGFARGTFSGQSNAGQEDAYLRKFDLSGNTVWTREFGTSSSDEAMGVGVDSSGVYVAGITNGTLPGQTSAGAQDAFARKYDTSGNVVWTQQFGTSSADQATGVAVDATGIYVVGFTTGTFAGQTSAGGQDAFVRKLDVSGNAIWTRQFGARSGNDAAQ